MGPVPLERPTSSNPWGPVDSVHSSIPTPTPLLDLEARLCLHPQGLEDVITAFKWLRTTALPKDAL